MSKITQVYDAFVARVVAVLPSHLRLSDPYLFLKNTDAEKRQGYGVRVGPGEHTGNNVSCDIILRQEIVLVLTRIMYAHETESTVKADVEKLLLEDLFLVISDVESNPSLQIPNIVLSSAYQSHGGIEFLGNDRDGILKIEAIFRLRYREDLN